MVTFASSVQLSRSTTVRNLRRHFAHRGAVSTADDIFTALHRNRCLSRLQPIHSDKTAKIRSVKTAAVLVPFCLVNKTPSVLLTVRSAQLLGHKGQVRYISLDYQYIVIIT